MNEAIEFSFFSRNEISELIPLAHQLNPKLSEKELEAFLSQMFEFSNYYCFGLMLNKKLIALSSGWMTVRFYSGKQLEVDNVIVDQENQSNGYGKILFQHIENWAKEQGCNSVELNTYLENRRSHKFYHQNGFSILGFHFCKFLK
ncbi:GNAT family N-acetyltransferase [Mesonia aestuariivivens]|uniref:GNAT family N-acetyltransferase n=1 Tax=Mesonia aestuariivivens TaxID=2796128 RepID=A0ABS6W3P3_9FLAO|nr:GNAT family N-acetyltransferase [Mesonia aestuariivivens]MBW2962344.1 GNAT family N-acetyltransferase [Mesonia aestuariivivens]